MSNPNTPLLLKPVQLRLIQEIAQHGQLQMAAEACGMTQPAASRMLADIEQKIGARLFLRQPKGMEPTEIGFSVLRRAQAILREYGSMASDIREMKGGEAGSVRIGAVTGPAVDILVSAIREVKATSPKAEITVDVQPSRELLTYLAAGEMDLALARILPEFDSKDFNIREMSGERIRFLVRAGHPMTRHDPVTLTQLLDYEWIMQTRGAPIREATLAAFASVGIPEPVRIVNSASLLFTIAYLSNSDAVSPLSEELARMLTQPPINAGFSILRTPHDIRVSPYYLLSLRRRVLTPLAQRFQSTIIRLSDNRSGPG